MAKPPRFTEEEVFGILDQMQAKGEHISPARLKQIYGGRHERYTELIDAWKRRAGQPVVTHDDEVERLIYTVLERQLPVIKPEALAAAAQAVASAVRAKEPA